MTDALELGPTGRPMPYLPTPQPLERHGPARVGQCSSGVG